MFNLQMRLQIVQRISLLTMNHVHGKSLEKHVEMVEAYGRVLYDWISCVNISNVCSERRNKCQYLFLYSVTLYTDPIHSDSESKPLESRSNM